MKFKLFADSYANSYANCYTEFLYIEILYSNIAYINGRAKEIEQLHKAHET